MAGELGREMPRGRRAGGEIEEDGARLRLAVLRVARPMTVRVARLVEQLGELEIAGRRVAEQPRAPGRGRARSTVQPVSARANSVTSAWV